MGEQRRLVLASRSPRRARLLGLLGATPEVRPADIDEGAVAGIAPRAHVLGVARRKAAAVPRGPDEVVLAADTAVVLDGTPLGKPADPDDASAMLRALGGRSHEVLSGVAVVGPDGSSDLVAATEVELAPLDRATIEWYVATSEPFDKAGGYGIQGRAAAFVRRLHGSWTNVVGLPLAETVELLRDHGVTLPRE